MVYIAKKVDSRCLVFDENLLGGVHRKVKGPKDVNPAIWVASVDLRQHSHVVSASWQVAWLAPEILPSRSTIGVAELGPKVLIEAVITASK